MERVQNASAGMNLHILVSVEEYSERHIHLDQEGLELAAHGVRGTQVLPRH